jgi:hypothetical protein
MKTRYVAWAASILLVASVDATAEQAAAPKLRDVASGSWGFAVEGASCADNPHTISFSPDGSQMLFQYSKSLDHNPPTKATYRVLSEGEGFLRMEKVDEPERTAAGAVVQWDLVLLSRDSYCWHRTDWQENGCTQPATRCSAQRG